MRGTAMFSMLRGLALRQQFYASRQELASEPEIQQALLIHFINRFIELGISNMRLARNLVKYPAATAEKIWLHENVFCQREQIYTYHAHHNATYQHERINLRPE